MSKTPKANRGRELMALRSRARRPDRRPGRHGRNNRKQAAIREAS